MSTTADTRAAAHDGPQSSSASAVAVEKATVAKGAAVEGAQSVAEAVRRVADAAVAEVQKSNVGPPQDFQFVGTIGGRFHIRGDGFSSSGTVKVNGVQVHTLGWSAQRIEGDLPKTLGKGTATVEVIVDDKTKQQGTFKL